MTQFRAGDVVYHAKADEEWVVKRVKGDYIEPAGWPPCRAKAEDCVLVEAASDEEHERWLALVAESDARR